MNSAADALKSERKEYLKRAKKQWYACPHCNKRFRAVPQRTVHSPYPMCPRCGVAVSEQHRTRLLDRTRKVTRFALKWALAPIWFPLLAKIFLAKKGWGVTRATARGTARAAAWVLSLPVSALRWYGKSRFASPEDLERYLAEVKGQWADGARTVEDLEARQKEQEVSEARARQDEEQRRKVEALRLKEQRKAAKAEAKAAKREGRTSTNKVMLSKRGEREHPDPEMNPRDTIGAIVREERRRMSDGRIVPIYQVQWANGEVGEYREEHLSRV
ncbi:MAG: zinc ribbon domain-containing protein [Candidatus Eiseniibacteriota bacterium]|nr:MAG: zinc ribbon domain-containing protein [Candidatus Eisenbacteria bacterium]